jgi:hypothetical protein
MNIYFDGIHPILFYLTDNELQISVRQNNFITFNNLFHMFR